MRLWHAILSKTSYGKEDGAEFMVTEEEDIVPVKRKSSSSSSAGRGPGRPKKEREDRGDGGGNVGGTGGNVGGAEEASLSVPVKAIWKFFEKCTLKNKI